MKLVLTLGVALVGFSTPALAQSAPVEEETSIFDVVEEILSRVSKQSVEHFYEAVDTAEDAEDLADVGNEESSGEFRCKLLEVLNVSTEMCVQ